MTIVPDSPCPGSWLGRPAWAGWILFLAVLLVYQPVWRAGYVWDDDVLVTINPCIVGPQGFKEIWTTRAADICPLTITTLWAAHKLWGLSPLPYHLLTVCLHAASAVLLWRVLLGLRVPGAWIGAALWALHPVQVESTAWIAEIKNTQSGVFFLLTILCFLRALKVDAPTILCAALAMASKSSTVILPVVLCLVAWWMDRGWRWRRLKEVAPVIALSAAATALSVWTQWSAVATASEPARPWPQRLALAGDAAWFYLGKVVWPHPLITVYPRWEIDVGTPLAFLPLLAVFVVSLVFWRQRRTWGLAWWLTWSFFIVALLPTLGLVEMSYFRYSFVADHFVYLASMAPLALAGAGLSRLGRYTPADKLRWPMFATASLLVATGFGSWHRGWVYRNQQTLWDRHAGQKPTVLGRLWQPRDLRGGTGPTRHRAHPLPRRSRDRPR